MCKSGLASLAMFFYDFREDQKKDLRGLLSSVLFQLGDQSDSYYNILSAFYSAHREGAQSPTDNKLVQCFKRLLKAQGQAPVYLIIDALDECSSASALSSPRDEVLKLLEDLIDSQLPNLRICVTSRPEVDIKSVLGQLSFRCISLHDERGQQEDIENYIKAVVNTNKRMRRWTPEHTSVNLQETFFCLYKLVQACTSLSKLKKLKKLKSVKVTCFFPKS
jgi:NACHT domain